MILGSQTATKGEMDEGFACISFTVDNLDNTVQKLKDEDVDVKFKNYDDGTQRVSFLDSNDVEIVLTTAAPPDMSSGEETEIRLDGLALKTDDVEDSVQFYTQILGLKEIEGLSYEDDEDYVGLQAGNIVIELLSTGWFESEGFDHIDFTVNNLNNTVQKLEDETQEKNTQKTLAEQAQQYQSALDTTQKQLNETHAKALEPLRQEARQTRNRLTAIAVGSAIIAITALIVAFLT